MIIMSAQPSSPATVQKFRWRFIVGEWALKITKNFSKSKPFSNRKFASKGWNTFTFFVVFVCLITLPCQMVTIKLFNEYLLIENEPHSKIVQFSVSNYIFIHFTLAKVTLLKNLNADLQWGQLESNRVIIILQIMIPSFPRHPRWISHVSIQLGCVTKNQFKLLFLPPIQEMCQSEEGRLLSH